MRWTDSIDLNFEVAKKLRSSEAEMWSVGTSSIGEISGSFHTVIIVSASNYRFKTKVNG